MLASFEPVPIMCCKTARLPAQIAAAIPSHRTMECVGTRSQQNHTASSQPLGVVVSARRSAIAHSEKPVRAQGKGRIR